MGYQTEIRTLTEESAVVVGASCDHCGTVLECVEATREDGSWFAAMALGSLDISVSGGYGQFFDDVEGARRFLFCAACSRKLIEAFPCIDMAIHNDGANAAAEGGRM